ncbi:MAG TPA: hypothetical protein VD908_03030 [Cytophagales bacterium]|nr:hypothetical protein [Cytophagales bacterium]
MIPSEQTEAFLIQNFPEIKKQLNKKEEANKTYYNMSCFAAFTQLHIQYGNFDMVKRCFEIANDLLIEGDDSVKSAVANCYLQQLNLEGIAQQQLVGYLPGELKNRYRNAAKTAA